MPTRFPWARVCNGYRPRDDQWPSRHPGFCTDNTAHLGEHHRDAEIGDFLGQHVGCVGHANAALAGRFQVDGIIAHPVDRDDFQTGQSLDQGPICTQLAARRDAADVAADLREKPGFVSRVEITVHDEFFVQRPLVPGGIWPDLQYLDLRHFC